MELPRRKEPRAWDARGSCDFTSVAFSASPLGPLRLRLRRFVFGRFLVRSLFVLGRFLVGSLLVLGRFLVGSLLVLGRLLVGSLFVLRRFLGSFWVLISRPAAFGLGAFQVIASSFGSNSFRTTPLAITEKATHFFCELVTPELHPAVARKTGRLRKSFSSYVDGHDSLVKLNRG